MQGRLPLSALVHRPRPEGWEPCIPNIPDHVREFGFDTETTGLRWWRGDRPVGFSLAWRGEGGRLESCYVPHGHRGGGNVDVGQAREFLRRRLRGCRLFGLNIRFDGHMEREDGVDLEDQGCRLSDVGHYAALLDDKRRVFSLESIAQDELGEGKLDDIDSAHAADYAGWEVEPYGKRDAELALRILEQQRPRLEAEDLLRVADLEDAVIFPTMEMERNGAPLDVPKLSRWCRESEARLVALRFKIAAEVGFQVNPDSPDDLAKLFRIRGHHSTERTPGGKRDSYTDAVLARVAAVDPVIADVRVVAHLADLRSKFLVSYLKAVEVDGVLRYALHQLRAGDDEQGGYGTVSGRFSSTAPIKDDPDSGKNIQQVMAVARQIELHGPDFIVRELFIPGAGLYLGADARQIEARIFVGLTRSERLLAMYRKDPLVSFHQLVWDIVSKYNAIPYKRLKNYNFAKLFGAGVPKAARMVGLPECQCPRPARGKTTHTCEAGEMVRAYDSAFPEAKALLDTASHIAEDRGYVKTALGRRARFAEGDRMYSALNRVIQGTAADIMKRKLVELHAERRKTGFVMRMTVHDEVTGDAPDAESARMVAEILDRQTALESAVPILWETKTGRNWAECK